MSGACSGTSSELQASSTTNFTCSLARPSPATVTARPAHAPSLPTASPPPPSTSASASAPPPQPPPPPHLRLQSLPPSQPPPPILPPPPPPHHSHRQHHSHHQHHQHHRRHRRHRRHRCLSRSHAQGRHIPARADPKHDSHAHGNPTGCCWLLRVLAQKSLGAAAAPHFRHRRNLGCERGSSGGIAVPGFKGVVAPFGHPTVALQWRCPARRGHGPSGRRASRARPWA